MGVALCATTALAFIDSVPMVEDLVGKYNAS